jgi:hypothetical protein
MAPDGSGPNRRCNLRGVVTLQAHLESDFLLILIDDRHSQAKADNDEVDGHRERTLPKYPTR